MGLWRFHWKSRLVKHFFIWPDSWISEDIYKSFKLFFKSLWDCWNLQKKQQLFWKPYTLFATIDEVETCFFQKSAPFFSKPIQSMYGIFPYIWLMFMVNVRKYTIPGCYGNGIVVYHVPSFFIQQKTPDIATLGLGWVCFGTPKRTKLKNGQNRKKWSFMGVLQLPLNEPNQNQCMVISLLFSFVSCILFPFIITSSWKPSHFGRHWNPNMEARAFFLNFCWE